MHNFTFIKSKTTKFWKEKLNIQSLKIVGVNISLTT